jgi:hypothetical protein
VRIYLFLLAVQIIVSNPCYQVIFNVVGSFFRHGGLLWQFLKATEEDEGAAKQEQVRCDTSEKIRGST